jgi:hypothetical protein
MHGTLKVVKETAVFFSDNLPGYVKGVFSKLDAAVLFPDEFEHVYVVLSVDKGGSSMKFRKHSFHITWQIIRKKHSSLLHHLQRTMHEGNSSIKIS